MIVDLHIVIHVLALFLAEINKVLSKDFEDNLAKP